MSTSRAVAFAAIALLATACKVEGDDDSNDMTQGGTGALPGTAGVGNAGSTAGPVAGNGMVAQSGSGATQGGSGAPVGGTSGAAGTDMTAAGVGGEGTAGSEPVAGGGGPPPVVEDAAQGCDPTTKLLKGDEVDTSKLGPWPVGEKTVKFGRFEAVEVMYPAVPGSEEGMETKKFDLRAWLPDGEREKVPDAQAKEVTTGAYADLPIDDAHGPYPVVILVHGTGAFRVASGTSQTHWASHGFVVVAAEHPNLFLTDTLKAGCGGIVPDLDLEGDVRSEIDELTTPTAATMFLAGHIDMTRIALIGHSAGAFNVADFSGMPGVQVIIPLSGTNRVAASATLKSVLYISGKDDTVLPYGPGGSGTGSLLYPGSAVDAFEASPGPPGVRKRLVGITGGGHLAVTDLCQDNSMGDNPLEVAQNNNVCGLGILPLLFDCGTVDREAGLSVVDDVSTAALEESLHCHDRTDAFAGFEARHPNLVSEFREEK